MGLGGDVMKYLPGVSSRVGGLDLNLVVEGIAHRVRHAVTVDELPEYDLRQAQLQRPDSHRAVGRGPHRLGGGLEALPALCGSRRPSVLRDLLSIEAPADVEPQEPLPAQTVMRDCA